MTKLHGVTGGRGGLGPSLSLSLSKTLIGPQCRTRFEALSHHATLAGTRTHTRAHIRTHTHTHTHIQSEAFSPWIAATCSNSLFTFVERKRFLSYVSKRSVLLGLAAGLGHVQFDGPSAFQRLWWGGTHLGLPSRQAKPTPPPSPSLHHIPWRCWRGEWLSVPFPPAPCVWKAAAVSYL